LFNGQAQGASVQYSLRVITPPAERPVSLAEAKAHLRVTASDEDALINRLIGAATEWCEDQADLSLVSRTLEAGWDCVPENSSRMLRIPRPPLVSVTSMTYLDVNGTEQTIAAGDYVVDSASQPGRVVLKPSTTWPVLGEFPNALKVRFVAGYGAASAVPDRAKQACMLLIAHWYENRQEGITGTIATTIDSAARSLLRQLWHGWY
jgi:uncharacterized phiE125 gp8 family phage protein